MKATVGIIGSGTMGAGIAQVAVLSGFTVLLHDASPEALANGVERILQELARSVERGRLTEEEASSAREHIRPQRSLAGLESSDTVIEAAAEDIDVKRRLFAELDRLLAPQAVLATNTSSLSVTAIATATRRPESVVGMHFFNPPPLMKLVEVVRGAQTSDETIRRTTALAVSLGKSPVVCSDTPGFIVNRVARPFYGEALRLLGEGIATVEEIDRIVRLSGGFKMGPFELMDLIGIDVNYAVTRSIYEQFFHEPRFRPHPIQRRMVEAGLLGRKTKRGFYDYR